MRVAMIPRELNQGSDEFDALIDLRRHYELENQDRPTWTRRRAPRRYLETSEAHADPRLGAEFCK